MSFILQVCQFTTSAALRTARRFSEKHYYTVLLRKCWRCVPVCTQDGGRRREKRERRGDSGLSGGKAKMKKVSKALLSCSTLLLRNDPSLLLLLLLLLLLSLFLFLLDRGQQQTDNTTLPIDLFISLRCVRCRQGGRDCITTSRHRIKLYVCGPER